jgi:hypothetical protein
MNTACGSPCRGVLHAGDGFAMREGRRGGCHVSNGTPRLSKATPTSCAAGRLRPAATCSSTLAIPLLSNGFGSIEDVAAIGSRTILPRGLRWHSSKVLQPAAATSFDLAIRPQVGAVIGVCAYHPPVAQDHLGSAQVVAGHSPGANPLWPGRKRGPTRRRRSSFQPLTVAVVAPVAGGAADAPEAVDAEAVDADRPGARDSVQPPSTAVVVAAAAERKTDRRVNAL